MATILCMILPMLQHGMVPLFVLLYSGYCIISQAYLHAVKSNNDSTRHMLVSKHAQSIPFVQMHLSLIACVPVKV